MAQIRTRGVTPAIVGQEALDDIRGGAIMGREIVAARA